MPKIRSTNSDYRFWWPNLESRLGVCSAGLIDVCPARRMWPHPPSSAHPGDFQGLVTKCGSHFVLLMMDMLVSETRWVNKFHIVSHLVGSLPYTIYENTKHQYIECVMHLLVFYSSSDTCLVCPHTVRWQRLKFITSANCCCRVWFILIYI
jgi:hypothetical protein